MAIKQPVVVITENQGPPRMIHRSDCPHFVHGITQTRPAVATEVRALRECSDCARKEG